MQITDEYINKLFEGTDFGTPINNSVLEKRKTLRGALANQTMGFWSGSTMYRLMIRGGFLIDAPSESKKKLTLLGEAFIDEVLDNEIQ